MSLIRLDFGPGRWIPQSDFTILSSTETVFPRDVVFDDVQSSITCLELSRRLQHDERLLATADQNTQNRSAVGLKNFGRLSI